MITLSARQRYVLGWLDRHKTHFAGWNYDATVLTIRGKDCCIRIQAQDWNAIHTFVGAMLKPGYMYSPNENGREILEAA